MLKIITLITTALFTLVFGFVPLQGQTADIDTVISVENVQQLVEITSLPVTGLARVAWSPDGDTLAVADATSLRIYDTQTFALNRNIRSTGDALELVYSPNGRYLAVSVFHDGTRSGTIRLITLDSSIDIYPLASEVSGVLAFSPDSRFIAFVNDDGYINIYDVETKALNRVLPFKLIYATGLAFSPNGNELAIGDMLGNIQLWDINTQELVGVLSAELPGGGDGGPGFPWSPRNTVVYTPDGQYIVSGSTYWMYPLRFWDRATSRAVSLLQRERINSEGRTSFLQFNSVAFNTGGTLLVTTVGNPQGSNTEIDVWDVQAAIHNDVEMHATFPDEGLKPIVSLPQSGVSTAVFNPDSTFLAATGANVVKVWGLPESLMTKAEAQALSDVNM